MKPSEKAPSLDTMIKQMFGFDRKDAIENNRCVPKPIGCGQDIDPDSYEPTYRAEYVISGLCEDCQKRIFSSPGGGPT